MYGNFKKAVLLEVKMIRRKRFIIKIDSIG